jgi:hypothetical protein
VREGRGAGLRLVGACAPLAVLAACSAQEQTGAGGGAGVGGDAGGDGGDDVRRDGGAGGVIDAGIADSASSATDALADGRGSGVIATCDLVRTRAGASAPEVGTPIFGADPTPQQIHLGLAADPRTSIAIQWRTADDVTLASTVQLGTGEGAGLDQLAEGMTFTYHDVRMHEVHLCDLAPDTTYRYRVGGADETGEHWSPTYSFRTAPDPGESPDAEVTIAFVGDSRGGNVVWAQIVEQLLARAPDLVLFGGDAVGNGNHQWEWDAFFTAAEPLLATTPMVVAHGNHEINAVNYYAQLAMMGDEESFAFDYGPAHLTVLNDSPVDDGVIGSKTRDFLAADLDASDLAPWQLVIHHRPLYSASPSHGGDPELRALWQPLYDAHGVDLVLNAHEHNYERTLPMRWGGAQATPAEGTIYIVSGGAGAGLYPSGTDFWTAYSESTHSAVILEVRQGSLEATAIREDGSVLDSFSIVKP